LSGDFSEAIAAVRDRVNIVDVISQRIALKKAGKNYRALCPFHHEKTPSFMVNEEKQIFHCFGCGAGGDVFTFLMRYENLSFYDALIELARSAGVSIPKGGGSRGEDQKRELLFQINETAADYFHANLVSKKVGSPAREYLARRGIRQETIEEYRLGYAPPGWTNLVSHFRRKSVDPALAQTLGLIIPRKRQGWYDQFRNRIIFPIMNTSGRTVGFGGGAIDETMPKYMNSAESAVYKKSQSIYGIQTAGREIRQRDSVLLVEGYFDLLTLHQSGFRNAVAPLGTALTRDQVRIMKRYSRNFIVLFDSDEAGIRATFRSLDPFMEEEIHPRTVSLPRGYDPDSFVREAGPEALAKALERAVPLVDAFIDYTVKRGDLGSVAGKVEIGRAVMPVLKKLRDPLERRLYVRSLSERLGVTEGDLVSSWGRRSAETRRAGTPEARAGSQPPFPASEEDLVELMLNHHGLIPAVFESGVIDDFESDDLRRIAGIVKRLFETRDDFSVGDVLGDVSEERLRSRISLWALSERFEEQKAERAAADCIREVKIRRLKRTQDVLTRKIKDVEKTDQTDRLNQLLREKQRLSDEERSLRRSQAT